MAAFYCILVINVCLFGLCAYLLWQNLTLKKESQALLEEQFDWIACQVAIQKALEFYEKVQKDSPDPKFTGEVARRALRNELH